MEKQHERRRKRPAGPRPRSSAAQTTSGFDLEHQEGSGCPARLKSSLLDSDGVSFDVRELLRFEGALVHAENQGASAERDLFVHVLQEVQDAGEVVVDHEVLDPIEQDDGPRRIVQEIPDQIAQAVQVVRIDVVLAQRRLEPHVADVFVAPPTNHVVRVLPGDVQRPPVCVYRLLNHREGPLRLLLLHEVGPSLLEVLLLPEEQVLEKLVLLEGKQERPWKWPHGTGLLSGGPFLYVSYRLSGVRLIRPHGSQPRSSLP